MKYIKNYTNQADYNADTTRPTDSSVVSSIEKVGVKYEGKNVFVPKESADVGDILVSDNGELKYIKLDTYDATLITVAPIGVVYYRTNSEIRVIYKDALGSEKWAAPMRIKVEGFDLVNGGTHTITVNSTTYNFTYLAGATLSDVATAIVAALPTGVGWTATAGTGYVVIQRDWYTPAISIFTVSGLTITILNSDKQANLTGFLTTNANIMRNSGYTTYYAGGNYEKFLQYYEINGAATTNTSLAAADLVKRSVFNAIDNPILFGAYGTYENYIQANMVKIPYSSDAMSDYNGQQNTDKLASYTYIDDNGVEKYCFPAARAAKNVTAGNVNWWLPSVEEMAVLIGAMKLDYSDKVNRSLNKIGTKVLVMTTHWTSSERYSNNSWFYNGYNGSMNNSLKNYSHVVRAVSAFYF